MRNNRFAPITFEIGFIKASLERVVREYVRWQHLILRTVSRKKVSGALDNKLSAILPLDTGAQRLLFSSTQSDWVAIFDNGVRSGGQATNAVAIISERLDSLGLTFTHIPNTYRKDHPRGAPGLWGALSLSSFGRKDSTAIWGTMRSISLRNDVPGWRFQQMGEPWEFEDLERYRAKKTTERLDAGLLVDYLERFGIRVNDDAFYDGPGVATRSRFLLGFGTKTRSLEEVQRQIRIPE